MIIWLGQLMLRATLMPTPTVVNMESGATKSPVQVETQKIKTKCNCLHFYLINQLSFDDPCFLPLKNVSIIPRKNVSIFYLGEFVFTAQMSNVIPCE